MRLKLYMSAYFLAHAVYQSYMSLFYKARGLSSAQIGLVFAAVAALSIPGQLLFGGLSDRAKRSDHVLRALILVSAALLFSQLFANGFAMIFVLSALFGFFYTSVQPLSDAAVLTELDAQGKPFGPVRLMGALAFAVLAFLFGFVINAEGRESWVVATAAALLVVLLGVSFLLPKDTVKRTRANPLKLLKEKQLRILLLFTLPAQITMGYYYAFFPTHFMELTGATGTQLGIANLIAAVAEIPFLLLSDRLYKKFGAGKIVGASTLVLGVRWLIAGMAQNPWVLVASQVLHGLGYIAISVSMALYISQAVPEQLRASGQALLSVFCYGLARVIGNALGGLAAQQFGQANGFLFCTALCTSSLLLFFSVWRRELCKSPNDML